MKKRIIHIALILIAIFPLISFTQDDAFELMLEPVTIEGLPGVQSFAFGQNDGKWLVVGGRLDGLHRRQPFASFDLAGHNDRIIVIDPETKQVWSTALTSLSTPIQEQLSSTNMQFYQYGDMLYCIGGYGFSATQNDHTTYDKLTAINVPQVIDAVINEEDIAPFIRQISDEKLQVTGGYFEKISDSFYLLGGQKFIGRYNPMGPNHGPGFIQEYTNSIFIFNIIDNGSELQIEHLNSYTDSENLHRRDYNAVAQIMPDGNPGITMFSGVFQHDVDLPFLNCVNIDSDGYSVNNDFIQHYNHYHCAFLPIYSSKSNEMHTVFFGGIAQFYDDNGTLVQDDNVPFVNTIARVTRDANGNMTEHKMRATMPGLLGASAEFVPNPELNYFDNAVLDLDKIENDTTLAGYILGGINSTAPNIFFSNTGTQSKAESNIYKVFIIKNNATSISEISKIEDINLVVYPNPNNGLVKMNYHLNYNDDVQITISDIKGKIVFHRSLNNQKVGLNKFNANIKELANGNTYLITIETSKQKHTQKIILER